MKESNLVVAARKALEQHDEASRKEREDPRNPSIGLCYEDCWAHDLGKALEELE